MFWAVILFAGQTHFRCLGNRNHESTRCSRTGEFALGADHRRVYPPVMRPLWALVIYIVVVFFGGALLAPWLCWLAQFFAHFFPKLANTPFHRFMDRSFLILALAGVWPLLRALGVKSPRETGLVPPYGQSKKVFGGLLLGFVSLAVVAGIVLASGGRALTGNAPAGKIIGTVLSAAGTAAVVATLEEILFRGGVFGGLRRMFYWPLALGLSSLVYALVHFLRRADFTGVPAGIPASDCCRGCWPDLRIFMRSFRAFSA